MLVGNRVPPNIKRSLDHHGIAWREFSYSKLKEFLETKNDIEFLKYFEDDNFYDIEISKKAKVKKVVKIRNDNDSRTINQKVEILKSSNEYKYLKSIIEKKKANEENASMILKTNLNHLKREHLVKIFTLIDEPYTYLVDKRPWFGRLLKPNANNLINQNETKTEC